MRRFWSRSLSGQFIAVGLLAVALAQGVSLIVYRLESARRMRTVLREEFLGRAASAYRLAEATPPAQRAETLASAGTPLARYWLSDAAPGPLSEWQQDARAHLVAPLPRASTESPTASLFEHESMLEASSRSGWENVSPEASFLRVPLQLAELREWNGFGLAVRLEDHTWLNIVYAKPSHLVLSPASPTSYAALGVVALVFSAGTWLLVRRISQPLKRLTHATERLGRGEEVEPLPEEGPDDLRTMVTAFNRMQVRLRRFVEDRTRMLAAIGHDLRTPITTLRLRAEFVTDADTREKLLGTLDEMQAMTEATLAFARSEAVAEPTRVVDVTALIESLCDDLKELGANVEFAGNGRLPASCRPDALRRAVRNVIENAVRYGDSARVNTGARGENIEIVVEDDGPGIAESDRERVFAPFVRLEASRNRNTGGVGLGLAIARSILRAHGGDVELGEGARGLRVRMFMPRD